MSEGKEDLDIYVEGVLKEFALVTVLGVALVVEYVAILVEQSLYL